ncbi:MAG: long-chain-fatty-acid--CoA ligase [Burkholderiales bacterium]
MQLTQTFTRAVQTRGRFTATIFGERTRTWRELGERVPRMAAAIRAFVEPGARVAVLALNSDRYIEMLYATAWSNTVLAPLNTRWALAENLYALRNADCDILFVDEEFVGQARELIKSHPVRRVVYMGEGAAPQDWEDYEALVRAHAPMDDDSGSDNDLCALCYTGGTTGHPKGVMLSHKNLLMGSINWVATLHFDEDTVYLHSAGLFHLAGTSPAYALTLAGGTHVLLPKFDPVAAFEAIERHKVNYCLFVPTMVNMLINHPAFSDHDLTSVKYCEYGASPMPDAVLALAMEKLPTWTFIQGYGQTESSALNLSLPWRNHFDCHPLPSKRQGTGIAAYGIDVRIVDPEGREVPRGQTGEIAIRGAQVMLGYWRNPEATAAVIRNKWLHTGDAAFMDEDGFVFIVDRVKDMIISGGENVYSKEVENALHSHPGVSQCAVIGIPSERWGEAVHAVVVLKDGQVLDEAGLIDHCRTQIAGYKCPRSVEFRDALPLSGAGKLMKHQLRAPYWAGKGKSVN